MRKYFSSLLILCVTLLLCSCQVTPPKSSNVRPVMQQSILNGLYNNKSLSAKSNKQKQLPSAVSNALTPGLNVSLPDAGKTQARRFNISVNNVPARDFFMGLVKDFPESIMVSPDIKGAISLTLKKVTVPEVLGAVRDVYGYDFETTDYGYKILPRELQTRIFTVNFLDILRNSDSETTISSGQISSKIKGAGDNTIATTTTKEAKPSTLVSTTSKEDVWKNLTETVKAVIGNAKGSKVIVNPTAGLIVARAYPGQLRRIAQYLDSVQNIMKREVIIEAKVLEVRLRAQYQAGINWNILGLSQTGYKNFEDPFSSIKEFSQFFKLAISHGGDFSTVINLLNAQGNVNVLSNPRVSTLNNQKAVIKVGEDRFYITNIESTTTTNSGSTGDTVGQDVDFTPFFSGIALDVTPQVDGKGNVTMHIHPIVSKVTQDDKKYKINDKLQEVPMAQSEIRESDSIVRAKSGQVIIIGGLMEDASADYQTSAPGADQLPGIKNLFKSPNKSSGKFELVILLKATVVGSKTWLNALHKESQRFHSLPRGEFAYTAKLRDTPMVK
ncbi:MAG: pilus (MSHA type) biogenesis protein MshL [Gammaproteobacteria bacterium]|nr:pilus (MSHA type) biogenesis protein MshL [Gammaproteobacteria bacterium]